MMAPQPSESPESTPSPDTAHDAVLVELRETLAPRIQVLSRLGAGGMAAVYLGRDPLLRRSIAIKVMSGTYAGDETARTRFTREAQAIAAIAHPNVIGVYDVGELRSRLPYFLMQLVEGRSLEAAIAADGAFAQARAKRVVGEVAAGLAAAHARGLVHRDVKPANVLLDSESGRAIVVDFGISSALDQARFEGTGTLTVHGSYVGTPRYTSPEQAAGEKVTGKSDVYSLGILAWELVVGRAPFEAASPMALLAAHIKDTPAPLRTVRPDLEPEFADLIEKCLRKDPAQRPEAAEIAGFLVPAPQVALEWPPPGLEELRGQGAMAARSFSWVGGFLLAFILALSVQPSRGTALALQLERSTLWSTIANVIPGSLTGPGAQDATPMWLLLIGLAFAGAGVTTIVFTARATRLLGALKRGRSIGYPSLVLFDAAMDDDPDTAELRNGSGRFAMLSRQTQNAIARSRRIRDISLPAGFAFTIVLTFLWAMGLLPIGGDSAMTMTALEATALALPALSGIGVASFQLLTELKLRGRMRGSSSKSVGVRPEFVTDWLERSKAPQSTTRSWTHILLPGLAMLGGAVAVVTMYVLVIAAVIATGNVTSRRVASMGSEAALRMTSAGRRLDRSLSELLRRGPPASVDPAASVAIAVGYHLAGADSLESPALGERDREQLHLHVLVLGTLRADTFRLGQLRRRPIPGEAPVPRVGADTVTPWLGIWRRFGRTTAGIPPFAYPGSEQLALHAESEGGSGRGLFYPRIMGRSFQEFSKLMRLGRVDEARPIAFEHVRVATRFLESPFAYEYSKGVEAAVLAVRMLTDVAAATRDTALRSAAQRFTSMGAGQRPLGDLWVAAGNVGEESIILEVVGNRGLRPYQRWNAIGYIVDSFCASTREILTGVSPTRLVFLDSAARRAADIPRTDQWVAVHKARLERLIAAPAGQAASGAEEMRFARFALRPVSWMGLRGMHARMSYCVSRRQPVW